MVGRRLAHFLVIDKLGAGGMGEVYRAHDEQLDRDVALKVLPAVSCHDPAARARLLREARAASKLNHPNICTIHEVGEADGQVYIAMELVEGRSLSSYVAAGPQPPEQVMRYGIQLADALAHAHQHGIIHRDLKSANVIITRDGRAKVLDFGLAKRLANEALAETTTQTVNTLTVPGTIVGTLAYLAPEQLLGQPADARSDIWSLGVVLYEMAAGRRPFHGQSAVELSSAILNQPLPPLASRPGVVPPAGIRAVIERCLEKDPLRRFQRGEELRAALEIVQSGSALPVPPDRKPGFSRRRWIVIAAPAIVVPAAATLYLGHRSGWFGLTQRFRSLAVLPVTNLSGDPQQEYFVDGMTDAFIAAISEISALKVISRTSVMVYKGAKKPLPQIARDLDVDSVLESSVVREAGLVRVVVQLIEAATDRSLWSQTYQRELTSILSLQGEVARAVARAINAQLRPVEQTRLAAGRKVNPASYEAYLRGMYHLNKATPADIEQAMKYLHEAVEKDPADPLAYAGLAAGYITIAHGPDPADDSLERAKAAARTALKLDDTLAETLVYWAFVEGYYDWKWDDAYRDTQRALDINPSLAFAHYQLAWFHYIFGRMPEAIEEHKRAQSLDPFNPLHTSWLGELYRQERRFDEAIAEARRGIKMAPADSTGYYVLGFVYLDQKLYDLAFAAFRDSVKADPETRWALGVAYATAGRMDEARKVQAELNRQRTIPWTAFWQVALHAALGEVDEAYRWINYPHQHAWIPAIRVLNWHGFDALRKDPRFPAQMRRMNLPW